MRVICGPMVCQECKRPVYFAEIEESFTRPGTTETWRVRAITDRAGERHKCIAWKAA